MLKPAKPIEQRVVIRPKGTRGWEDVNWNGTGHRAKINAVLGTCCRYYYPGLVEVDGDSFPAHKWVHWKMKVYRRINGRDQSHADMVQDAFWEQCTLVEGKTRDDPDVRAVFEEAAKKVVKDAMRDARVKAVIVYHKRVEKVAISKDDAAATHLTREQYLDSEVDWLTQHEDAWPKICEYWASNAFKDVSDRNRANRKHKPGLQRYGADGHIGKAKRMEHQTGVEPSLIDVFMVGHKGPDPDHPEILCDDSATEKLQRYAEEMQRRHGPEVNWRSAEVDIDAVYVSGGGVPHGRLAIGDGILDPRGSRRSSVSSVGTSRSQRSTREEELADQLKTTQDSISNLTQQLHYMQAVMQTMWMQQSMQMYGGTPSQVGRPSFSSPAVVHQTTQPGDAPEATSAGAQQQMQWPFFGSQLPPTQPPIHIPIQPPIQMTTQMPPTTQVPSTQLPGASGMGYWPFGPMQWGLGSQGMQGVPPFQIPPHPSPGEASTSRQGTPHTLHDTAQGPNPNVGSGPAE